MTMQSSSNSSGQGTANPEANRPTVTIHVDGAPIDVPEGKNLLEALIDAGDEVSYFCYHPGLSVVAKCRQCLVGIGDGHKLVPACQSVVQDGMQIRSNTEQVKDARRALLEFTLLNHPVDCVICDKAGECALQRQYMDWDAKESLLNHTKVDKPKRVDIGPRIVLDAERCILCDRCVRFCDEVVGEPQLTFAHRGDHTILTTAPGQQLDNAYSLNTVDICPVGALTDKDFRFRSRVWDLFATRSACNGCATACNTEVHHKDNEVYRLVPPRHWDMNENWMCDYGRSTYKALGKNRISEAAIEGEPAELADAIAYVREKLDTYRDDPSQVGFVLSADATNEDNYALARLGRDRFGGRLYLGHQPDTDDGDTILRRNDPNPNRAGARACGGAKLLTQEQLAEDIKNGDLKALYIIGHAITLPGDALRKLKGLDLLVVQQSTNGSKLAKRANVILPAAMWAEVDGTIMSAEGAVKRLRAATEPPGYALPHWRLIDDVGKGLSARDSNDQDVSNQDAHGLFIEMIASVDFPGGAPDEASWGPNLPTARLRWGGRRG